MSSFALEIQQFCRQTDTRINLVIRRVVLGILREVVRKSPVDTGRFRANWQLGVNSRPAGEVNSISNNAVERGLAAMPAQAAGNIYYVVNNLDYAQALEDGHSRQSPPGNMVAGTVAEFRRIVREALQQ